MSAPNGSTGLTYFTPDGGQTWTVVQSLGGGGGGAPSAPPIWAPVGGGGVFSAGGVAVVGGAGGSASPSPEYFIGGAAEVDPLLARAVAALVDLFDGNAEVAKTCAYDHPRMTPERCAEIAEVVDACRRWQGGAK